MATITIKQRRKKKPSQRHPINWRVFEGKKAFVWPMVDGKVSDAENKIVGSYLGSTSEVLKERGVVHNAIGDRTILTLDGTEILPTDDVTILLGYEKRDATNRASGAFGDTGDAVDAKRCGVHLPYSDGTVYFDYGGTVEGTTRLSKSGLTVTGRHEWAFTTGPRGMEIWQDGVKVASNSGTPTRTAAVHEFRLGYHGYQQSDLANYYYFIVVHGQLSEPKLKQLGKAPNDIYMPRISHIYDPYDAPAFSAYWAANATITQTMQGMS